MRMEGRGEIKQERNLETYNQIRKYRKEESQEYRKTYGLAVVADSPPVGLEGLADSEVVVLDSGEEVVLDSVVLFGDDVVVVVLVGEGGAGEEVIGGTRASGTDSH
jgi:hypothetical protein